MATLTPRKIAEGAQAAIEGKLKDVFATRSNVLTVKKADEIRSITKKMVNDMPVDTAAAPVYTIELSYSQLSWFEFKLNADGSITVEDTHATGKKFEIPKDWSAHFLSWNTTYTYEQLRVLAAGGSVMPAPTPTDPMPPPPPPPPPQVPVPVPEEPAPTPPLPGDPFGVSVSDGTTFNEAEATALAPWTPPGYGFTQQLRMQKKGQWTAHFRRDGDGRCEVILERGRLFGAANAAASNTGTLSWSVTQGGKTWATRSMTKFNWMCRDVWESAPAPIRKTVSALVAAKLVQPYSTSGYGSKIVYPTLTPFTPMGYAGMLADQGSTGGRFEIGLYTGPTAWYLAAQSTSALAMMRAQADAIGSWPIILRDENTGRPVSLADHPNVSTFKVWRGTENGVDQFQPYGTPHIATVDTGGKIDGAHWPEVSGVLALLTGNLRYFEDLQFAVTALELSQSPDYRGGAAGIFLPYQVRYLAWVSRILARAAAFTPEGTHATLLPASYFKTLLENNRAWFMANVINSTNKQQRVFHDFSDMVNARDEGITGPGQRYMKVWMNNYYGQVVEEIVDLGFSSWLPIADYALEPAMKRLALMPAYPCNYADIIARSATVVDGKTIIDICDTHEEAFALTKAAMQTKGIWNAPADNTLAPNQDFNYVWTLHAHVLRAGRRNEAAAAAARALRSQALALSTQYGPDIQLCLAA